MKLSISHAVRTKLSGKNPPVTEDDILQCFANRNGKFLIDTREDNATNPFTRWFISETDNGMQLKVCFIPYADRLEIKTAYVPNTTERQIYSKYGEQHDG